MKWHFAFPTFFFLRERCDDSVPLTRPVAGFVLLLLVCLSTPVIKPLYILSVTDSASRDIYNVGIFGYCYSTETTS